VDGTALGHEEESMPVIVHPVECQRQGRRGNPKFFGLTAVAPRIHWNRQNLYPQRLFGGATETMWQVRLPVAFMCILPAIGQTASPLGTIEGLLIYQNGKAVTGAKVHAELRGVYKIGAIHFVMSDEAGHFLIDRLPMGTYDVFGGKEEENYPDTFSPLGSQEIPFAVLSVERPLGYVIIVLGPQAGVLTATVRDGIRGKPINAIFTISRLDDPHGSINTSAAPNSRILVPSFTNFSIEVSAEGYWPWTYFNPVDGSKRLRLEPGRQVDLAVELQPAAETVLQQREHARW
jgi:hypothetical protein